MSAALHHQLSLASSAALSASDHDLAFHLQLSEAIQASLSSNAAAPSHPAPPPPPPEEPSDASCALAVHAADLARAEQDHRDAQACRAYHARAAASVRVAAHDALFARDLAAIPEDKWAHDGDYFERPLPLEGGGALFRVLFKGMASREVGVRVTATLASGCSPSPSAGQGGRWCSVEAQQGRMMLEAMALVEGLNAALALGIRTLNVLTDNKPLHNHVMYYLCLLSS